eukprot:NODE_26_length_40862_cov_0.679513.p22 type:complete len:188 gc:universal NODE_26_length_40862_cov_0.679513:11032-11595(+)
MDTESLNELTQYIVWKAQISTSELSSMVGRRALYSDDLSYINHRLSPLSLKIEKAPAPLLKSSRSVAYYGVNTDYDAIDSLHPEIDSDILAFVLCYIYLEHQRADLEVLKSEMNKIQGSDHCLSALEKHGYIETSKKLNLASWGPKSRILFTTNDILDCLKKIYQRDIVEAAKKAGTHEHSFEIFRD